MNDLDLERKIFVYPNPAMDKVVVQTTIVDLKLLDVTGKDIQIKPHREDGRVCFSTHELAAGTYFLQIGAGSKPKKVIICK